MLQTQYNDTSVIYFMRIDTTTWFLVIFILHLLEVFILFLHHLLLGFYNVRDGLQRKKPECLSNLRVLRKVTLVFLRLYLMQNQMYPRARPSTACWELTQVLLSAPSTQLVSRDLPPKLDNNHTDKYLIL